MPTNSTGPKPIANLIETSSLGTPDGEPSCACNLPHPGGTHQCIHGTVYGPCYWAGCPGICEADYPCDCPCHDLPESAPEETSR